MIKICKNKNCSVEFKTDDKRGLFCSRSCAATYNNKKYPKRKRKPGYIYDKYSRFKEICSICGELKCKYAETCLECMKALDVEKRYQTPVKDFVYNNGNARVKYSQIRKVARQFIELWEIPLVCVVCGYDLHVQICHIKPIAEFEESGRVIDVNGPNNLVCLCPNHHWELDHGRLELPSSVTKTLDRMYMGILP